MARMEYTTSNALRRIAGRPVQVEAEYDGVQRREHLSDGQGVGFGSVQTAKWDNAVHAYRADGTKYSFYVAAFDTKPKALIAARRWVVTGVAA